jgi:hypothetical protein
MIDKAERIRATIRHTQIRHIQRMGGKPLVDLPHALAHDSELRALLKQQVSEKAREAERKLNRNINRVWSMEEWVEDREQKGCI